MAVVITHPEMGVYLGNCMGMGFWSMLDPVGQDAATVMPSEAEARAHVSSWLNHNDPAAYTHVTVTADRGEWASISALKAAGLGHLLGDMEADALRCADPAGSA